MAGGGGGGGGGWAQILKRRFYSEFGLHTAQRVIEPVAALRFVAILGVIQPEVHASEELHRAAAVGPQLGATPLPCSDGDAVVPVGA